MLWSEVAQSNKEKMFKTQWDHLKIERRKGKTGIFVVWYDPDQNQTLYGPYESQQEAKKVMEEIVDENVNTKYPFLAEPLTPENVDINGAANLLSGTIKYLRINYIANARHLKKYGFKIPVSTKEYREFGISKKLFAEVDHLREELRSFDKEDEPERYSRIIKKLNTLERQIPSMYRTIQTMEEGCYGAVDILQSGISGEEILKEWKREALGYR